MRKIIRSARGAFGALIPAIPASILVLALTLAPTPAPGATPPIVNYQGYLTDDQGTPLNGNTFDIEFKIYPAATGGSVLWGESHAPVTVTDGIFHVALGEFTPLTPTILDGERWLEITVHPDAPFPRQRLLSSPFAIRAEVAETALTSAPDNDWTIAGQDVHRVTGNVGIGTSTPVKKLHVETTDLGIDAADLSNENIVVEGADAIVGLYSNTAGSYGSGISLGEVSAGSISNRWDLTRKTTTGGNALEMRYFDGAATTDIVHIAPDGLLRVNGVMEADHLEARNNLPGGDPAPGGVYADNQTYAWGHVRASGGFNSSFGTGNLVSFGTGHYGVGVRTLMTGTAVVVTPKAAAGTGPYLAVVTNIQDFRFDVQIWQWTGSGFALANCDFYFEVVGRPWQP